MKPLLQIVICVLYTLLPLHYATAHEADTWLIETSKITDKVVFTPFQGGSREAHHHTNMSIQMTGIPESWRAETVNPRVIQQLLTTIHYDGNLNNGKHWPPFLFYKYLEECPQIIIEMYIKDKDNHGVPQCESLRLYLLKIQGHYWLELGGHPEEHISGGMVAVEPSSLHRFLSTFRTQVAQAKKGDTRLTLFYPQGD